MPCTNLLQINTPFGSLHIRFSAPKLKSTGNCYYEADFTILLFSLLLFAFRSLALFCNVCSCVCVTNNHMKLAFGNEKGIHEDIKNNTSEEKHEGKIERENSKSCVN